MSASGPGTGPPAVVGGYRLLERIGGGGMGEVYRAVHERLGRVAAVKFVRPLADAPAASARFLNEARIHAALEHPNIATLYDFVEIDGVPCIVMEYVPGPTLAERLRDVGPFSEDEALAVLAQLLDAVGFVHRHGIVHRDIKAGNVKIDPSGRVKLLDFGISRMVASPRITRAGAYVGTPEYLSPEQLRGEPSDERSDVWALGVLLHEMVTGRLPPPRDAGRDPDVPPRIGAIIARCLQPDPARRFPSVAAIAEEVARADEGEKKPSFAASIPWRPRKPLLVALGAVAAIAVVTFAILAARGPSGRVAGETVRVVIDSQPAGAAVYEDGDYVGETPLTLKRATGAPLRLVLRKEGCREKAQDVLVGPNTHVTVSLDRVP